MWCLFASEISVATILRVKFLNMETTVSSKTLLSLTGLHDATSQHVIAVRNLNLSSVCMGLRKPEDEVPARPSSGPSSKRSWTSYKLHQPKQYERRTPQTQQTDAHSSRSCFETSEKEVTETITGMASAFLGLILLTTVVL